MAKKRSSNSKLYFSERGWLLSEELIEKLIVKEVKGKSVVKEEKEKIARS